MRLVMRELTHRSKNLLAVVQAMARKTASTAPDTDSFVRDFSSRLRAIAAAHDLLVAESWSGAELRSLLAASLSQTVDPDAPEIGVEGPNLKLAPDAAQMLGLAFHELTMNAAKHGSLSVPRVGSRCAGVGTASAVRLCWREEGGPAVVPRAQRLRAGAARAAGRRVARRGGRPRLPSRGAGLRPELPRGPADRRLTAASAPTAAASAAEVWQGRANRPPPLRSTRVRSRPDRPFSGINARRDRLDPAADRP